MATKSRAYLKEFFERFVKTRPGSDQFTNDMMDSFVNKTDDNFPAGAALDETRHDLLNHTGLPGIHASGSDNETPASISALLLTTLQLTRTNYIYHAVSKTADTVGDWRQYGDVNGFYFEICTVANAAKGAGTWVNKSTIAAI